MQVRKEPGQTAFILGCPNEAADSKFIDKEKDRAHLEVGKLGDVVVVGGNPFDGYWNFLTAVMESKAARWWSTSGASRTRASRS